MNKKIFFWFIISYSVFLFACQRRHVCPAYQSSFILDQKKTNSFFSQFGQDSLPKSNMFVNKNKRGMIVKVKYAQKQKEINTVKMKLVYPPPADSVLLAGIDINSMEQDELDSLFALVPARRISHNREQEIYMRHIGQFYKWPDPEQKQATDELSEDLEKPKQKRKWFGRKKQVEEPVEEIDNDLDEIFLDF